MNSQQIYDELIRIASDALGPDGEMKVWYTTTSDDDPLFVVSGYQYSSNNPFDPFSSFITEFEPEETQLAGNTEGIYISFLFDSEQVGSERPEKDGVGSPEHYGANTELMNECANCRRGLTECLPPVKLVYPAESPFEDPKREEHELCINCRPPHYDDVVRGVSAFAVENDAISHVGFAVDSETEWDSIDEIDNPFIETAVEAIEAKLL